MRRKRVHYIKNQIIGLYCCLIKCILFNDRHIILVLKDKEAFNEIYDYLLKKYIQNKYPKKLKKFTIHRHELNLFFTNGAALKFHYLYENGSYGRPGTRAHEVYAVGGISRDMNIIFKCICNVPFKRPKEKGRK